MKSTWHRSLAAVVAAVALAVVLAAPSPAPGAPAGPPPLQAGEPDGTDADAEAGPSAADPPVVHSWALAPAGSDPDARAGNRPTLSYELAPGSEVTDAVTLFNYSNVQLTFQVYATDAYNNEDGLFDLLPGDQEPEDAGTWVTLPQENVTLAPRSQATFPITIRVPGDARPGDHAGAVLAASQAAGTGPDGKVVTLDRRTGSRLYVRVDGPLAPELAIEDLHTSYRPALDPLGGRATVTYRVRNRGNVRLGGRHRVEVAGPFGLLARKGPVQEVDELLPGESVEVRVVLDDVPASVVVFTDVDLEPFAMGEEPGDMEPSGRGSMAFAPPLTLIALALVIGLLIYARRAYKRHQQAGAPGGGPDGPEGGPDGPEVPAGPAGADRAEELLV